MKHEKIDGPDFEKLMKGEINEDYEKETADDKPANLSNNDNGAQNEKPEQSLQPQAEDSVKENLDNGMDPPIFRA